MASWAEEDQEVGKNGGGRRGPVLFLPVPAAVRATAARQDGAAEKA